MYVTITSQHLKYYELFLLTFFITMVASALNLNY